MRLRLFTVQFHFENSSALCFVDALILHVNTQFNNKLFFNYFFLVKRN